MVRACFEQWHGLPRERWVTIPGGVPSRRDVALWDVAAGMVGWLGLGMGILEVFSNLNGSVLQTKLRQCSGRCGLRA